MQPTSFSAPGAQGVQVGAGGTQLNEYGPRVYYSGGPAAGTPVQWPLLVGALPPRADRYQHRSELAVELPQHSASWVLSGMGGVGKTQVAADFAHRTWDGGGVDLLVWISATSQQAILTGYARAAGLVGLVDAASAQDAAAAARRFVEWLHGTDRRWLVVLDDLADPQHLQGWWLPARPGGQLVVTTRRRDAALSGADRVRVDVGLFTPEQARTYLTEKLASSDCAAELAADLGYLPLALAHAAAYLADQGLTCRAYRTRLANRRRLADLLPDAATEALPDDYPRAVAATWSLSVDLANRLRPPGLAGPVLDLCSLLDPHGVPYDLFTTDAALAHLGERTGREITAEDATQALQALHRLSLVVLTSAGAGADEERETPTVRVHGVVQRITREHLYAGSRADHDAAALAAADALLSLWPPVDNRPVLGAVLRANTEALHWHAETALWTPDAHQVLFRAGASLGHTGLLAAAIAHSQQLYDLATGRLGPDHPDTLTARNNLAGWRGQAGDPAGAAAAFEELLAIQLRVLGHDHPDTLATRNNLASWRGEAGDAAGAVTAFEELLAVVLRVLGHDHQNTFTTRNNLAGWRGEAGDAAGAVAAFEELLADRVRVLGHDHPDTLATRSNVASWRGQAGDKAGAVATLERLLADRVRILGAEHPDTLSTRNNLAGWRGDAGDAAGAVAAFEELLPVVLRVLGPDHPHTLTTRSNLARCRGDAGDPAGAVAAFEELLPDRLRVLGPDHPHTMKTRDYLAQWRGEAGDPAAAAADYEALLVDRRRILGADHPHTVTTMDSLARWRRLAQEASEE